MASLATVHQLRGEQASAAGVFAAFDRHLDRCRDLLSPHTVRAYRRQAVAYLDWLATAGHPDAFDDEVGATAAVTAWRRWLLAERKLSPATVNQGLAAVTLLYDKGCKLELKKVKRARAAQPGAPDALTVVQENALRRAAERRGVRDAAIVGLMLGSGARAAECARLTVDDVTLTARTGTVRLFGKGDQVRTVPLDQPARERVSAWLLEHTGSGALWVGRRGAMSTEGITQTVLVVGRAAGLSGLRPHRLRHTYATRLREDGVDVAQIQALLGHGSIETSARYFRASATELQALVDRRWVTDHD